MVIGNAHRETFLSELEKAQDDVKTAKSLLDKSVQGSPDGHTWEARHFLALQKVELIKQSLIANEIDY